MESTQLIPSLNSIEPAFYDSIEEEVIDLAEGKKESIEGAKFSAETVLKDTKTKEILGRIFGGFLGILVLFGSITNVVQDFKNKKKSPWIYSRVVMDFVASGALIGYALNQTIIGLILGLILGIILLLVELKYKTKKKST